MSIFQKAIFLFYFFSTLCVQAQISSVSHGDFNSELALRKIYHTAQVVSCKVFAKESDADTLELLRVEEYDREGKITRRLEFAFNADKDGNDTLITSFSYDEKGRMTGYRIENPADEEITVGYSYNDKNELTYRGIASAEAREFSFSYKKGLLVHEIGNGATQIKEDGRPNWTKFEETFFAYNKQKQRILETSYFLGSLTYTKEFEYDTKGNLSIERIWSGEKTGNPSKVLNYIYNDQNLPISVKNSSDGSIESYQYMMSDW